MCEAGPLARWTGPTARREGIDFILDPMWSTINPDPARREGRADDMVAPPLPREQRMGERVNARDTHAVEETHRRCGAASLRRTAPEQQRSPPRRSPDRRPRFWRRAGSRSMHK